MVAGKAPIIRDYRTVSQGKKHVDLFRIDDAHINSSGEVLPPHINTKSRIYFTDNQKALARSLDHKPIPQSAYSALNDFGRVAEVANYSGKALSAVGMAIDIQQLGTTLYQDITDEDKRIGKPTVSAAGSIAGAWLGGAVGAKAGAMGGAALGTMILPGLGTLIGGFVGGLAGGILGASVGQHAAEGTVEWAYSL